MTRDPARLRSNFEPGSSRWAVRRAQWRALGLDDVDMAKPKIAVVNTSSELAICFCAWKRATDWPSQVVPIVVGALSLKVPTMPRRCGLAPFSSSSSSPISSCSRGRSRSPSVVSVSRRVERTKSLEPRSPSNRVTRLVTTDGAMPISRAAAEKLPVRAVTRKASMSMNYAMARGLPISAASAIRR